jgi:hypothetical protein
LIKNLSISVSISTHEKSEISILLLGKDQWLRLIVSIVDHSVLLAFPTFFCTFRIGTYVYVVPSMISYIFSDFETLFSYISRQFIGI